MDMPQTFQARAYPWQLEGWRMQQRSLWAAHCAPERHTLEVMQLWCRQSGKNTLAAWWDTAWLTAGAQAVLSGEVRVDDLWEALHTAPTWTPGCGVHRNRLRSELTKIVGKRWSLADGKVFRVGDLPAVLRLQSANDTAERRAATANAYMRCDEVQSTSREVYYQELSPMLASTAAPGWFSGTKGVEESLQAQLQHDFEQATERDGIPRVLCVPWERVAEHIPAYGRHVEAIIRRLGGRSHPWIQREYDLVAPDAVGAFLSPEQLALLFGEGQVRHVRRPGPREGHYYVAGLDFCGAAEEPDEKALDPDWTRARDNTCVAIGELSWREQPDEELVNGVWIPTKRKVPTILVVDLLLLPGKLPEALVDQLTQYLQHWRVLHATGDARGVGDGPCASLMARFRDRWTSLKSGAPDVTRMGYRLLGAAGSGRLRMWTAVGEDELLAEARRQFRYLRKYALEGGGFRWHHPSHRVLGEVVHDDIPKACGYMLEAAYTHLARLEPGKQPEYRSWNEAEGYEGPLIGEQRHNRPRDVPWHQED